MSALVIHNTPELHQLKKAWSLLRGILVTYMKNIIM